MFETVVANEERVAVLRSECGWLCIILFVEDAGKKVILELRDKVLGGFQCGRERWDEMSLTLRAGSPTC